MTDEPGPPRFGHVVGENFRRLREARDMTQAEAAQHLRARGLMWTRSQVAALEAGNRESVDAPALLLLAEALGLARVADLVEGVGPVRLTEQTTATRNYVRDRLDGGTGGDDPLELGSEAARAAIALMPGETVSFQADAELAQRLGLRPEDVYGTAERLWGRNLHEERDRRVAEMGEMTAAERRVRRGHVTRQLARELAPHLPGGQSDGDD